MEDRVNLSEKELEQVKIRERNFLVKRLEYCKNVLRLEAAEKLKAAIAEGNLSENAAYYYAKNFQALIEHEIMNLENDIRNFDKTDDNGRRKFL